MFTGQNLHTHTPTIKLIKFQLQDSKEKRGREGVQKKREGGREGGL